MAARTPQAPPERAELIYPLGCHLYLVRFRTGQEDRVREALARWARNRELAFSWTDAAACGEGLPLAPLACDPWCDCPDCRIEAPSEPTPGLGWRWLAATIMVGAVAAPWLAAMLLVRWWWGVRS